MDRREEFLNQYLKHQAGLSAFILAAVADRQAAEDILQEVALTLWQSFDRYDAARPFSAWARGIATNKILKRVAEKNRMIILSAEAIDAVAAAYDRAEDKISCEEDALRYCLENLPENSRKLLAQRYEKSRKLAELALELGSTVDAVNKTLSRIRAGLQKCIEQRLRTS